MTLSAPQIDNCALDEFLGALADLLVETLLQEVKNEATETDANSDSR